MQELVKGTGRRMWFLNDPIEDLPSYTWENYEYNYRRTAVASLLHPHIWHYEICPWPHRVFDGRYPRFQPRIAEKIETSFETDQSKPIPQSYSTLLSGMFQLFGDMEQSDILFEGGTDGVGVFMSDSGLFQRTFPDGIVAVSYTHLDVYKRQTIGIMFIMAVGGMLNAGYDQILLLQQPANNQISQVLDTYIIQTGIRYGKFEYATAIGLFKSVFSLIMVAGTNYLTQKYAEVGLW